MWHGINDQKLDGNCCLLPIVEQECGVLCVTSGTAPSACPAGYQESLPFAADNVCNTAATKPVGATMNFCVESTTQALKKVNISDWRGPLDTTAVCYGEYTNVNPPPNPYYTGYSKSNPPSCEKSYPTYSYQVLSTSADVTANPGPYILGKQPITRLSWGNPTFIAIYSIYGAFFALNILWWFFKHSCEKKHKREDERRMRSLIDKDDDSAQDLNLDNKSAVQHGYNSSIIGSFLFGYLVILSLAFQGFMVVMVADYYGSWGTSMLLVSSEDLAIAFIIAWHCMTVWYCVLLGVSDKLRNFYRLRADLLTCQYLQIWRENSSEVFEVSNSYIMKLFARWEAIKVKAFGSTGNYETHPVQYTENGTRFIQFECKPQSYNENVGLYLPCRVDVGPTHADILQSSQGLTSEEVHARLETVGPNFISVYVPNWALALCQEFSDVYYIYQGVLLWVWFYFAYWQMGLVLLFVILGAGILKVHIKRKSELKIKKMAEHRDQCSVLRDGQWLTTSTDQLVPGDVFEVENSMSVPCDAAVIKGSCVIDESMLTGEAMPVQKFTVRNDNYDYDKSGGSKKMSMFAGTKVLQLQSDEENGKVLAIVVATGANTDKGELVSKILFPIPITFIFDQHLKMVFILLILWACLCFGIALYFMQAAGASSWFYGIFMVSQILSPLLPAVLVVGQSVAANRLSKKGIFCLNLHRITVSGKVQLFCFDKTGTLTREGLEFFAVQPIDTDKKEFIQPNENPDHLPTLLQQAMGTAHTISVLGEKFVGNPVDCEMFKSSGWKLQQHETGDILTKGNEEVKILKVFEFEHARMSMSVCFLDVKTNEIHVIVKGSYEKIKQVSNPESVPANYDDVTSEHAVNGSYTLGIAHKSFGKDYDINLLKSMQREDFESNCDCVGLIMFKNKLKDDAEVSIKALKAGNVRPIMITGDNALTGVYIGRQCGMTNEKDGIVILGDVRKGTQSTSKKKSGGQSISGNMPQLQWTIIGTGEEVNLEDYVDFDSLSRATGAGSLGGLDYEYAADDAGSSTTTDCMMKMTTAHGLNENGQAKSVELAVTGKAFDILCEIGMMRSLLLNTRIFARMTPDGKVKCVELHMERGITAMCGDGGNDCGALRAAHAGLALSDAEASIVSPFSSNDRGVNSVVRLLREGRGALATSFSSYKYLLWYGETIVFMKMMILYFGVSLSQYIWMLLDSFVVVVLSYAISQAKPTKFLSAMRPSARLLGIETVTGVTSIVLINVMFLCFSMVLLFNEDWFVCNEFDSSLTDTSKWWLLGDNWEGETLGVMVMFQALTAASLGNFGADFRLPWFRNWIFVIAFCACFLIFSLMLFLDPNPYGCAFRFECGDPEELVKMGYFDKVSDVWWDIPLYNTPNHHNVFPMDFRWKIFGLAVGNMICDHIFYWVVMLGPVRRILRRRYPLERLSVTL